jgi:hypothetical protein
LTGEATDVGIRDTGCLGAGSRDSSEFGDLLLEYDPR